MPPPRHLAPHNRTAFGYGLPPGGPARAGAAPDPRPIRLLATVDRLRPAFGRSALTRISADFRSRHRRKNGQWGYRRRLLRKTVPAVRLVESVEKNPEERAERRGHGGRGPRKPPPTPLRRVQKLKIVLDDLDDGVTSIILVSCLSLNAGAPPAASTRPQPCLNLLRTLCRWLARAAGRLCRPATARVRPLPGGIAGCIGQLAASLLARNRRRLPESGGCEERCQLRQAVALRYREKTTNKQRAAAQRYVY